MEGEVKVGKKLCFFNKAYIYLSPNEEVVLDMIVRVLQKAKYNQMGSQALIETVREAIGTVKRYGHEGKVQRNTILKGVYMLLAVTNCKKVGSSRVLKMWEIKRKRYIKLLKHEKVVINNNLPQKSIEI